MHCNFCHIALVKAEHSVSPDSRGWRNIPSKEGGVKSHCKGAYAGMGGICVHRTIDYNPRLIFLVSFASNESIFPSETMKIILLIITFFESKCLEGQLRGNNFNI